MANNETTDARLVEDTLAGDREAFGCLYDRYARLVRAVVAGITLDWPMVHDLTQECFLRAFRNLHQLREPNRFGAWIVGIARQVGRERRRTLRRDPHRFVGNGSLEVESLAPDAAQVDAAEEWSFVLRKLSELEERERLAIQAFFLLGQNGGRAAETLELSRSGFYVLLARAVARLAALVCSPKSERETKT